MQLFRAIFVVIAAAWLALVPAGQTAFAEQVCDPQTGFCSEVTPTPSPGLGPTVSPSPSPTASPKPTATPKPTPAPAPTPGQGCGDFFANPLQTGLNCSKPLGVPTDLFQNGNLFTRIANLLVFLVGAISVIMIIIGGLRYVVSMGNPKSVTAARDTILNALIGVVIAAMSFAIINFVINALNTAK